MCWRRRRPVISGSQCALCRQHGGSSESHECKPGLSLESCKLSKRRKCCACSATGSRVETVGVHLKFVCCCRVEASGASQQYECVPTLTTAKRRRTFAKNLLARSPKIHISPPILDETIFHLLKNRASRQENAADCNGNCAPADKHIFNPGSFEPRLNVYAARPQYFDALLKHCGRSAGNRAMAHQVGNGTT